MPTASSSKRLALLPHPTSRNKPIHALAVLIDQPSATELTISYLLSGSLSDLRVPEPRAGLRTDGLWRHTCFEIFIAQPDHRSYWEYNFSPSSAWAAYQFSGYREGMAALLEGAVPAIDVSSADDTLKLSARIDLSWLVRAGASALRLGVAAVIEDRAEGLSYWALNHPVDKPDFHHAGGFVVLLD